MKCPNCYGLLDRQKSPEYPELPSTFTCIICGREFEIVEGELVSIDKVFDKLGLIKNRKLSY